VQALLDGRKTQTRRILKPQPPQGATVLRSGMGKYIWDWPGLGAGRDDGKDLPQVRYVKGDRLWVRENWRPLKGYSNWDVRVLYGADNAEEHFQDGFDLKGDWQWPKAASRGFVPSIHMPRWASRLTLTVADVRVQRLQDISRADAIAEGIKKLPGGNEDQWMDYPEGSSAAGWLEPVNSFDSLWESINGPGSWVANPFVWALTFTVHKANIDHMQAEAA